MNELEKALIRRIQELMKKANASDTYYEWWKEEKKKREELEKKLEKLTMAESDENV